MVKQTRYITQEDLDSAARGLNLVAKPPSELREIMARFPADAEMFAARVIHLSAKQLLRVKLANGARG